MFLRARYGNLKNAGRWGFIFVESVGTLCGDVDGSYPRNNEVGRSSNELPSWLFPTLRKEQGTFGYRLPTQLQ